MGLEANHRHSRSTAAHLLGRGCLALIVALVTLSLHVNTLPVEQQQPIEAASTSPFWLDPPPLAHDTLLQRHTQPSTRMPAPAAAKSASLVVHPSQPLSANTNALATLSPVVQMPVQHSQPVALSNHKIMTQSASVVVSPKNSTQPQHANTRMTTAQGPSSTDQEFARTFAGSENTLTAPGGNPVQDLHQGLNTNESALSPNIALQAQRSPDNSSNHAHLAAPIQLGDVAVKTEALVEHSEPTSTVQLDSRYDAVKVRTSITVPTFHHPLRLSVGGGYEHLVQPNEGRTNTDLDAPPTSGGDSGTATTGTSSAPALNGASRLDLQRTGYVATASLPVNNHLNVGVGYSQHQLRGGAGLTQGTPIEEHQELYTGSVTYAPGDGRSSVSIVGRASHAIDTLAPVDATVKRGDILFSVKF